MAWPADQGGIGISGSAALSQVPYAFGDAARRDDLFPEGRLDADLQQVDLRHQNSWRLALHEVPAAEMLEVQLVNAVAPFILCARLKALMMREPTGDRHIVNVSAMEGIFSRGPKTDKHPHTNMAKAALNMMTLTASRDYVEHGIHMNAVDTGWVTDEDPAGPCRPQEAGAGLRAPPRHRGRRGPGLRPVLLGPPDRRPPLGQVPEGLQALELVSGYGTGSSGPDPRRAGSREQLRHLTGVGVGVLGSEHGVAEPAVAPRLDLLEQCLVVQVRGLVDAEATGREGGDGSLAFCLDQGPRPGSPGVENKNGR